MALFGIVLGSTILAGTALDVGKERSREITTVGIDRYHELSPPTQAYRAVLGKNDIAVFGHTQPPAVHKLTPTRQATGYFHG